MKQWKFIKIFVKNKKLKFIILLFFIWRVYLFLVLLVALVFFPLAGKNFLGGGYENYLNFPWLFAWGNFDGEHYLSIAQIGYRGLEQAFFPVYPMLMRFLASLVDINQLNLVVAGLVISNLSFLVALFILYKLILLDYSEQVARLTIILIFIFPTSFYFGSLYNESFFLLLMVSSFYFLRQNNFFLSSVFGAISSATRIFGLILLPSYLIELWQQKIPIKKFFWIFIIPIGLLSYMVYQWMITGDPLAFYHLQKIVGEQHQGGLTLLPQVYLRYIKMLTTTDFYNPIYSTILLEFVVGVVFFILPIYGFFQKIRLSYLIFALVSFLLPTIQGSFSSVPRYVLILFPSFLSLAIMMNRFSLWLKILIFSSLIIWLGFETMMFIRGYWVS